MLSEYQTFREIGSYVLKKVRPFDPHLAAVLTVVVSNLRDGDPVVSRAVARAIARMDVTSDAFNLRLQMDGDNLFLVASDGNLRVVVPAHGAPYKTFRQVWANAQPHRFEVEQNGPDSATMVEEVN